MNKWCNITQDIFRLYYTQKTFRKTPLHELLSKPLFWWTLHSCFADPAVIKLLISRTDCLRPTESYRPSPKEMPPGLEDIREMVWEDIKLGLYCMHVKVQLPNGFHHFTLTFIYLFGRGVLPVTYMSGIRKSKPTSFKKVGSWKQEELRGLQLHMGFGVSV